MLSPMHVVGRANALAFLLLPVAAKLKAVVMQQSKYREMMLEGLLSIAEGENPRSIEMKLEGFLD